MLHLDYPRLSSNFRVEALGDSVCFLGETRGHTVTGKIFVDLIPLMDGTHSFGEILATFPKYSVTDLTRALSTLHRNGCIVSAKKFPRDVNSVFWDQYQPSVSPSECLSQTTVEARFVQCGNRETFERALRAAGLQIAELNAKVILVVFCNNSKDDVEKALSEIYDLKQAFFPVSMQRTSISIGPFVPSGASGSFDIESFISSEASVDALTTEFAANWSAMELAKAIVFESKAHLQDQSLTWNADTLIVNRTQIDLHQTTDKYQ